MDLITFCFNFLATFENQKLLLKYLNIELLLKNAQMDQADPRPFKWACPLQFTRVPSFLLPPQCQPISFIYIIPCSLDSFFAAFVLSHQQIFLESSFLGSVSCLGGRECILFTAGFPAPGSEPGSQQVLRKWFLSLSFCDTTWEWLERREKQQKGEWHWGQPCRGMHRLCASITLDSFVCPHW